VGPELAIPPADSYLQRMLRSFEFCIPIAGTKVPVGPDWLIKYDGYGLRLERDGDHVPLITKGGYTPGPTDARGSLRRH
jgi:hypothetical protein